MEKQTYDQLCQQQAHLLTELRNLPDRLASLEAELDQVEIQLQTLPADLVAKGEKLNGQLQGLAQRKRELLLELETLQQARDALQDRLDDVSQSLKAQRQARAREAKIKAMPKLREKRDKLAEGLVDTLAELAALTALIESMPVGVLPFDRIVRMNMTPDRRTDYTALKSQYLAEVVERYHLEG